MGTMVRRVASARGLIKDPRRVHRWREGKSHLRQLSTNVSVGICCETETLILSAAGNYFSFPSFDDFQEFQENEESMAAMHDKVVP